LVRRRVIIRRIAAAAVVLLLAPIALLAIYRFAPPPGTPLMLIRLIQGEGLAKRWKPLDEIAPALANSVIAAEDNLFCRHGGFDWKQMQLALDEWEEGGRLRGASTITMQTAKNLFLWPGQSWLRKGLEAYLAVWLELLWPKRRILEVYLNVVELGPGVYGAEAAAQAHFGRSAARLTQRQAALLAAVLPNPRRWSAARPTPYIARRADMVIRRIGQLGPLLDCAR
jgi:monofunctional biosynthetic peptidoglycan transglycosylase